MARSERLLELIRGCAGIEGRLAVRCLRPNSASACIRSIAMSRPCRPRVRPSRASRRRLCAEARLHAAALMFSKEEIEAHVLGARWVSERADGSLSKAARNALAKILAVLPSDLHNDAERSPLIVGPGEAIATGDAEIALIRKAIRAERKLDIAYADGTGALTRRFVRPLALGYFDRVRVVIA
jgi:predicted DNA-binding transcriptional regulator YafY